MQPRERHILVTGAGGFLGNRLCAALLADHRYADARLTATDRSLASMVPHPRLRRVEGDISEKDVRSAMLDGGVDLLFHLAGILGGAAEANYELSRRVNVDATLSLFEELRAPEHQPRVIFASTIAVYGAPLPQHIDDDTPASPTMVYGAQKLMMEGALAQFTARSWLDGISLRLPGIMARPSNDIALKSGFLSNVFYAIAKGEDIVMPVEEDGFTWLLSVAACVEAFMHAGVLPRAQVHRGLFLLPAQRVRIGDLVAALRRRFPASGSVVTYRPEPALQALFAAQPPLTTALAESHGFRHDGDLDTLVARAFAGHKLHPDGGRA